MSNPDVKLTSIILSNFRGARTPLTLDLSRDGRSCAIYGNNGEGKSTITQAIEWFYKDAIAALKGELIDDKDIVNVAAESGDDTTVGLFFNKKNLNATKTYVEGRRRTNIDNRTQEFITYHEGAAQNDRIYLDQRTIARFVWESKGDKRKELAKIVGLEDIVTVKGVVSSTLNELQRSPRLRDLETRLQYNQGQLTSAVFGEAVSTLEGLYEHSSRLMKKLSINDQIESMETLDKGLQKALQTLPADKAGEKVALEAIKQEILRLCENVDFSVHVSTWLSSYEALIENKERLAQINLYDLLKQAEKVLENSYTVKNCPLCEQTIESGEALLRAVIERYKKLSELREQLQKVQMTLKTVISVVQPRITQTSATVDKLKQRKISFDEKLFKTFEQIAEGIISQLQEGFSKKDAIALDKKAMAHSIAQVKAELVSAVEIIDKQIAGLSLSTEERERLDIYNKLTVGKNLVLESIIASKEIAAFKTQIKEMTIVESDLLQLQKETLQKVLDTISNDVNKYFNALNKKDGLQEAKLELVGEEGVEFSLMFYGSKAVPPRKFLSESQINSLGIAFFLAAVKHFNKVNRFFVLDDVLLSFDSNYRMRLLDLLESEFADHQVLLLTHEEYWFDMIKKKFPAWIFKKVNWKYEDGITFQDSKLDKLDVIRTKHDQGENVGNDLRSYLEGLLKDICLSLQVRVPFRSGIDNERRMVGELFPALTAALRDHRSSIKDASEYRDLEMSAFVANIISHHNPGLESDGDTAETIDKISKFRDIFKCPKGRFINRAKELPGKKKVACPCGCIDISWQQ